MHRMVHGPLIKDFNKMIVHTLAVATAQPSLIEVLGQIVITICVSLGFIGSVYVLFTARKHREPRKIWVGVMFVALAILIFVHQHSPVGLFLSETFGFTTAVQGNVSMALAGVGVGLFLIGKYEKARRFRASKSGATIS